MNEIIAGTGHRPDKLGGYAPENILKLRRFAREELRRFQPKVVISGMAQGWDQALAWAAIQLNIPFWAYIPFRGQEMKWPVEARLEYHNLLDRATRTLILFSGDYAVYKMHLRNEKMVDDCQKVLALWDGTAGGTCTCVLYARSINRPIENSWKRWREYGESDSAHT